MSRNILLSIIFTIFTTAFVQGQAKHAQWTLSTKKVSNCEYDLIVNVAIDKGWHTFSINKIKGAGLEVFPTEITFKPNTDYTLVGNLTETKPTPEYDPTIKKTVLLHYNKVVFVQRVRLNSKDKVQISGTHESQLCNDRMCETTPKYKFDFDLQGTQSCLK